MITKRIPRELRFPKGIINLKASTKESNLNKIDISPKYVYQCKQFYFSNEKN
jgi:hypothetical protein